MKRRYFHLLLVAATVVVIGDVTSADHRRGIKSGTQPQPALLASAPDHHFRSKISGAWTNSSNWESSPDSIAWSNSTLHPTHEAASITINDGHTVEINTAVSVVNTSIYGELTLTTGGRIKIGSGNGTGITVKNTGRFRVATSDDYSDAIEIPQLSEPGFYPVHVQSGGTVVIEKPSGENSGKGFEILATLPGNRWDHRSVFIWNNGLSFATSGTTYFPTAIASVVPIFVVSTPVGITASPNPTTINGVLAVQASLSLGGSGDKHFRNGITGMDTLRQSSASGGRFIINGENAILGGNGLQIDLRTGTPMYFEHSLEVPKDSSVNITGANIQNKSGTFTVNGTFDITDNQITNNGIVKVGATGRFRSKNRGNVNWSLISVPSGTVVLEQGSTIEMYATSDTQYFKKRDDFTHLIFSGSGIKKPSSKFSTDNGSISINGEATLDCTTARVGETSVTGQVTNLTMTGGRLLTGTTGTSPAMEGTYNLTGGVIDFTNNSATPQTIRKNNYYNIEITGTNVKNSNGNISIREGGSFVIMPGGIFTSASGNASIVGAGEGTSKHFEIKDGGLLRTLAVEGFYGPPNGTNPSASVQTSIPIIILHPGSIVEYARKGTRGDEDEMPSSAEQKISSHPHLYEYQHLTLSGDGKKTAPASDLVIKGDFRRTDDAAFIHNNGKLIFNGNEIQKVDAGNSLFFVIENRNSNTLKIESDLRIHHSLKLSEQSKLHLNTGDIVIVSDTERTARIAPIPDNATITYEETGGRFVVERYIPKHSKAWQLLSVPTKGSTIKQTWQDNQTINSQRGVLITGPGYTPTDTKGFDGHSPSPSMKYLNPATGLFKAIATTDNLINDHTAYFLFVRGDRSVDGKMNVIPTGVTLYTRGKLFSPGTEAPEEISISANRWTMVGNPYASAVDFEKLSFAGGVLPGYYIWDPQLTNPTYSEYGLGGYRHITQLGDGAYTAVPDGGNYPSVGAPMIQSGQAFFVYSSSENTLRFAESAKTTESINVFRKMPRNEAFSGIRTNLYTKKNNDTILLDGTLHLFSEEYAEDIDQYDVPKLFNSGENIALRASPNHLIVERRPYPTETDTLYYSLTGTNKRNYLLHFSFYGNIFEEQKVYLNDSYRQISTHLAGKNDEVNFEVDGNPASSGPGRFYLTFQKVVHPFSFHNEKVTVAKNAIIISWQSTNEAAVKEYHVEYSYDGYYFMVLQSIALSKMKESAYQTIHNNPDAGIIHHRIKAIMENGDTVYSKLLTSTYQERLPLITTYPNPAKEFLFVNLHSPQGGKYRIRLLNSEGRVTMAKTVHHQGFPMKTKVDVSHLQDGIYEVQLINPDGTIESRRIVIE